MARFWAGSTRSPRAAVWSWKNLTPNSIWRRQQKTQPATAPRLHWDALSADLNYSPSAVSLQHGTLRRGAAQLGFSASATLRHGNFDENTSQLNLNLHIQNENVEDMLRLAGTSYPVTGVANADVQATGTLRNLRGGGKLQITKLTAYGEPFKAFSSDLRLTGTELAMENVMLAHNGARLTGSVAYDVETKGYRFDVTCANIEFANLQHFALPRLTVQGQAGFHLTGSGTEDAPVINGQIELRNIVLNHETVGNMTVVAETHGEDAVLSGRSHFENADLNLDGKVHLARQVARADHAEVFSSRLRPSDSRLFSGPDHRPFFHCRCH